MSQIHRPPKPEIRRDFGGWISGPGATDQVPASAIRPGDVIVRGGELVTVEKVRPGGRGFVLFWRQGSASGMYDVTPGEAITRMTP